MAQKVFVQLVDDLDGTSGDAIETVRFALDGVVYEIDLKEDNARKLRDRLADYVANARRIGGRSASRVPTGGRRSGGEARSKEQSQAIRRWARNQGHALAARGRIPSHVVEEFEQAHR